MAAMYKHRGTVHTITRGLTRTAPPGGKHIIRCHNSHQFSKFPEYQLNHKCIPYRRIDLIFLLQVSLNVDLNIGHNRNLQILATFVNIDNNPHTPLSYQDSGVDIAAGNTLVDKIKPLVRRTHRTGVLGGIGGFGSQFELPVGRYNQPVLVSGADGVGTKLMLATQLNKHNTIGIDLVAMCVNDIIVAGAEPLYFLDYFATGKLDISQAQEIIEGIVEGCLLAGCALAGGETAEMPDLYRQGDYDLAGFAVGVVEKSKMLSPQNVRAPQILLGIASSGPHSNGYSLIRKILKRSSDNAAGTFNGSTIGEHLLAPTRIYVKPVRALLDEVDVSAICHVTGGGITENLPRVLPNNVAAEVNLSAWNKPDIFLWIQENGNIEAMEMLRTFNCGIGMIVAIDEKDCAKAVETLEKHGELAFPIGHIVKHAGEAMVHYVNP